MSIRGSRALSLPARLSLREYLHEYQYRTRKCRVAQISAVVVQASYESARGSRHAVILVFFIAEIALNSSVK